jgi:hypothetical protein
MQFESKEISLTSSNSSRKIKHGPSGLWLLSPEVELLGRGSWLKELQGERKSYTYFVAYCVTSLIIQPLSYYVRIYTGTVYGTAEPPIVTTGKISLGSLRIFIM